MEKNTCLPESMKKTVSQSGAVYHNSLLLLLHENRTAYLWARFSAHRRGFFTGGLINQ